MNKLLATSFLVIFIGLFSLSLVYANSKQDYQREQSNLISSYRQERNDCLNDVCRENVKLKYISLLQQLKKDWVLERYGVAI